MTQPEALMFLAEAALRSCGCNNQPVLAAISVALEKDCPEAAEAAKTAALYLRESDRQQLTLSRILEDGR